MLSFRDFVPQMLVEPGVFSQGEYESFHAAVIAANEWIAQDKIRVINVETVVLPNIWSRWEEGSHDTSLGIGSGAPSRWHQFVRVWFDAPAPQPQEAVEEDEPL